MATWIHEHVDYRIGTSTEKTSAVDTFVARRGACRDYAHVMVAFTRAAGIPARLVSAYAWQFDPPDFHAVVDVWLNGRWRLVDASGLASMEGLVRIAVGRDATDISFMTIFGHGEFRSQDVSVTMNLGADDEEVVVNESDPSPAATSPKSRLPYEDAKG